MVRFERRVEGMMGIASGRNKLKKQEYDESHLPSMENAKKARNNK